MKKKIIMFMSMIWVRKKYKIYEKRSICVSDYSDRENIYSKENVFNKK